MIPPILDHNPFRNTTRDKNRGFLIKSTIADIFKSQRRKTMFRKKTTPWVMAMTMMGMMGVIEAQTIDKNWVRQNANSPFQANTAIRYANSMVRFYRNYNQTMEPGDLKPEFKNGVYGQLAPIKEPFLNAAEAVGAPHVDVVGSPTAPRTPQVCWEAAAWMKTGNNDKAFAAALSQELSKQGQGIQLNVIPGNEENLYISAACSEAGI